MLGSLLVGICWGVPGSNDSKAPCGPAVLVVETFNDSFRAFGMTTFPWWVCLKRLARLSYSSSIRRKTSARSGTVSILLRIVNGCVLELFKVIIIKQESLCACLIPWLLSLGPRGLPNIAKIIKLSLICWRLYIPSHRLIRSFICVYRIHLGPICLLIDRIKAYISNSRLNLCILLIKL